MRTHMRIAWLLRVQARALPSYEAGADLTHVSYRF